MRRLVTCAVALQSACAASLAEAPHAVPVEGLAQSFRAGDVVLTVQPDEAGLRDLLARFEIGTVINLASPGYMERSVAFDERALVEGAGARYVHLPLGGAEDVGPQRLRAIGEALDGAEGNVLLHSAWIGDVAAHWWALQALVHGLDPVEGYDRYRAMGAGTLRFPFEGYAGGRLVATGLATGARPTVRAQDAGDASGPLADAPVGLPVNIVSPEGVRGGLLVDGRFAYAGQPSEEALERFAKEGYTLVFNLRRDEEMENVDFDEAGACERLGLTYLHVPTGWESWQYTPEQLAAFADAIEEKPGRALIHCQVGWRAQHFWGAYLHRYRGYSVADALWISHSPDGTWPFTPYERLLGVELAFDLAAAP